MDILQKKGQGWETPKLGSSMLVAFLADCIFIRILELLLLKEYGLPLIWEQKFMSVTKMRWLSGLSVTLMCFLPPHLLIKVQIISGM